MTCKKSDVIVGTIFSLVLFGSLLYLLPGIINTDDMVDLFKVGPRLTTDT